MKKSIKRTHSADAANIFVRNLLCDISEELGGFHDTDLKKTLRYFNHCCAYTGVKLTEKTLTLDHLIPHNREFCGLHLYGNIVPASSQANKSKGSKSYKDFLNPDIEMFKGNTEQEIQERIKKIEEFQSKSGYIDKFNSINNLKGFVDTKYKAIQDLAISSIKEIKDDVIILKNHVKQVSNDQLKDSEIDKVKRLVPSWLKKPNQKNSKILIKYLDLLQDQKTITYSELLSCCSNIDNFKLNFSQLSKITKKNHAKVFEIIGEEVFLWEPIK